MKILHVIVGLDVGGAELMLKRLVASHVATPRYQHFVISLTGIGKVGMDLRELGVQVIPLGMRSFWHVPVVFSRLVTTIRRLKPDVVQTWMYHGDFLGGLAARYAGISNVIWGIRTTDVRKGGNKITALVRLICAKLSFKVPKVIVCAAEASRRVHVDAGYDASRMVVIPNGFDLENLKASEEQRNGLRLNLGICDDEVVIGSVARYSPVKDHQNFIAAASLLAAKYENVRFVMIGSRVDAYNEVLQKQIFATGYAERFVLLGERKDIPVCFRAMDIYCLHSRTEGFPNTLGEAMAMGLPCVATDVGDSRYMLGEAGKVVPAENHEALASGIEQLLILSVEERSALGKMAEQRVKEHFSMEKSAERFEELYESVAG